jgi:diguanylate cyclase (GGDEF)-like protein
MSPDVKVCRLLFVHRDPALADRIRGLLGCVSSSDNESGFRVAHLTHLTDALTYLKISPVDLVLIGPDPVGPGLVESIAELSATHPEVPIVALLTSPTGDERIAVCKAGARECLSADEFDFQIWTRTFEFCRREMTLSRELAQVTARLDWLVHMDSLTDLLNRKGMERAIMEELARCRREGDELLILLVDLDDFSRINATMGHGVGDLVLVGAARRIKESVRDQDMVGRCGTDRFVIMLPETEVAAGEVIAEKIRLAVSRDVIKAGGQSITTTASLGLTAISPTSLSFDEVLAKAHFVLQRSKLKGKNRVARAASLEEVGMIRPVTAGPEMVRALLRGNVLEVSSQPIVNLSDGRIVSREMLIRGPEGPLRRPDHLFSFCQENDITTAVDLRCLKLCAAAAGRLGANGHFHVNIMPATLLQTDSEELIRVLSGNGTDGQCCLEISEQQLLGDPSVLVPRVQAVQTAGIRIAIDDVGYGNSCLEGLIMLHPEVMKIDKRLVRGLAVDPEMRKALGRLLKVADVLEAEVVAEGIENTEDYHILVDMGVRLGQGYLFGRPCMCSQDPVMNGKKNQEKPEARANA